MGAQRKAAGGRMERICQRSLAGDTTSSMKLSSIWTKSHRTGPKKIFDTRFQILFKIIRT